MLTDLGVKVWTGGIQINLDIEFKVINEFLGAAAVCRPNRLVFVLGSARRFTFLSVRVAREVFTEGGKLRRVLSN